MSLNRRKKILLTFAIYVVILVCSAALGGLAWFHYGNPQQVCASCHEMNVVHAAWSGSAHRTMHCRNCHGGSLTLDLHALGEHLNRVVTHVKGGPTEEIHLSERDILTVHNACQACHPQAFADWQGSRHSANYGRLFLDAAHNKTEQPAAECLRCHGMFYDGHIDDLIAPVGTRNVNAAKGAWALKDPAKATQPAIPCLACHQVHTPATDLKSAHLYNRREKSYFNASALPVTNTMNNGQALRLSADPRQRLCVQCHAPNAMRQLGTGDDRTPAGVHEGLSCLDCHKTHSGSAKDSCAACHPAITHCKMDVEKMDTTFKSTESKHNIHFVGCGDCHNGQRPVKK